MLPWVLFNLFVLMMLALDLLVFHRRAHEIKVREALIWTGFWIGLAFIFNIGIYFWKGSQPALEFLTGYLIEESLSVDNLFVFIVIFKYFGISKSHQHKILFWGIIGAQLMRALFIAVGVTLLAAFSWISYVFGAILIITGIRLAKAQSTEVHPERNIALLILKKIFPIAKDYEGDNFFTFKDGKRYITLLFVTLVVVETTDLIFAVDSIPAILAITSDPFIAYTSNIFAILGLRSLFFALSGMMEFFVYLHYGLAVILIFVGSKMVLKDFYHIPIPVALGVVGGILVASIFISLHSQRKKIK